MRKAWATLFWLSLAFSPARGDQTKLGTPDLSQFGNDLERAAAAACDNSSLPGVPGGGTLKRYKLTYLYALTEYNIGTCAANGKGSWTLNRQQKCGTANCGKVTFGTLTGLHLGNGDCPDHTYSFAALCYTWTQHNNSKVSDKISATWNPPTISPQSYQFPIKVPIVRPKTEDTTASGWDDSGIGLWSQTVHNSADPNFDWSYDSVRETDPGTGNANNDTCWCPGSAFDQFWQITGGQWFPDEHGVWEFDHVGWCAAHGTLFCQNAAAPLPVQYYRQKRRAPCGTTFPQQMEFQATSVSKAWSNYGSVNTLGGSFDYSTVTSIRAGKSQTHTVDPQVARKRLACTSFSPSPSGIAAQNLPGQTIMVNDPRPLAAAAQQIQRLSGWAVTFEDAPLTYGAHLVPMVNDSPSDPALMMPKGGSLRFDLPSDRSAGQSITAMKRAAEAYNALRAAATFEVIEGASMAHVVPRQVRNSAGVLVAVAPVLDTPITIEKRLRTPIEAIADITNAVSLASGERVGTGTLALSPLNQEIDVGATNEIARNVLERVLTTTDAKMSWRLLYDPGIKAYFLNIAPVR